MEIKMFYKTQRDIAEVINVIIDSYWEDIIAEDLLIRNIKALYSNNQEKIIKDEDFTTILKQQCGKRRLEVVEKILDLNIKQLED
jgi:uncharacterized protein (TIGR04540 family)